MFLSLIAKSETNREGLLVSHLCINWKLLVSFPGKPVWWAEPRDMSKIRC